MLKAIIDSIESVPENLRSFYRPGEGDALKDKFILDVEPVGSFALEDVGGLRNAYTAVKDERDTLKTSMEGFKGLSARTVRERLAELDRLQKFDPETEADKIAARKAQTAIDDMAVRHKTELEAAQGRSGRLLSEVERLLLSEQAKSAIAKHKGSPELLLPHVTARAKVVENDDGTFSVKVMDENGRPAMEFKDGRAFDASIEDLVVGLKKNPVFGRAFEAPASGSGARGGNANGGAPATNPFSKKTFNLTAQAKLYREDPATYARLKAIADAEG